MGTPGSGAKSARIVATLAAALLPHGAVRGETLRVPADHSTIQGAIDAAEPGDTVVVAPGTYSENLQLLDGIDVRGADTARTLLGPDDADAALVTITAVSGVRFSHFTLIDGSIGIAVQSSAGIEISNVVFDAIGTGLTVDGISSVDVANNVFFRNELAVARGSTLVQVESNIFEGNTTAIQTLLQPGADPFANVRSNCFWQNADDAGRLVGAAETRGDPLFVAPDQRDFHLREGSECIDAGRGTDAIDGSLADAGVYGGPLADVAPFPVAAPQLSDASNADPPATSIEVVWDRNLSYRVTNSATPGGYLVHYKRGGEAAPPFDGTDAAAGTAPSPIDVGNTTSYVLENLAGGATAPLAPRLRSAVGRNESAVLTWEAAAGANGYRVYYGVAAANENFVDVDDVTTATVTGLVNGTAYRFTVSALDRPIYHVAVSAVDNTQARNQSEPVNVATISVGAAAESPPSNEVTATPEAVTPYPDLPDEGGCFIATAAFGADWAPQVQILRDFRDRVLARHAVGRWLVERYYRLSPPTARFITEREWLRPLARAALWPAVAGALLALAVPPAGWLAAAALLALALAARRRGRRGTPIPCCLVLVLLAIAAPAPAQEEAAERSPRWMYEIKGGYFYPDLDDYARFYGDDRDTTFAVAGGWRLREWLELAGEIGAASDRGAGSTPSGAAVPDAVKLRLVPIQVFATFIWPRPERRFVPYAGVGLVTAWYEQEIDQQGEREGRTDVGAALRAGVRWLAAERGRAAVLRRPGDELYSRMFLFFEAQRTTAESGALDLGGTTYLLGFRAEFEFGP